MLRIFLLLGFILSVVMIASTQVHAADSMAQLDLTPTTAEGPLTMEQIPPITSMNQMKAAPADNQPATQAQPPQANTQENSSTQVQPVGQ